MGTFKIMDKDIDDNGVFRVPDELIKGDYDEVSVDFFRLRKLKKIEGKFPESVKKLNLMLCPDLTIADPSILPDNLKSFNLLNCIKIQNNLSEALKLKLEDLIKKGCKIYPENFLEMAKMTTEASKTSRLQAVPAAFHSLEAAKEAKKELDRRRDIENLKEEICSLFLNAEIFPCREERIEIYKKIEAANSYQDISDSFYSILLTLTNDKKEILSKNIALKYILKNLYGNAINTKDKEKIDFFSEILLKITSLSGEEAKERALQRIEQILNTKSEEINQRMKSIAIFYLTSSDVKNFLEKYPLELFKQIKLAIINPEIYLPALRELNSEIKELLKKDGKLAEYEEYSRQTSEQKTYCSIGNMNFVLNPNRFEHWNKNPRKAISEKLKKHGLTLIDENGEYVTFYGFVDEEKADNLVKSGTIFTDNQVSQAGLIHGKFTHAIQMYILACAIENGKIKLPDGISLKDIISDIVDSKLWREMFDSSSASLDKPDEYRCYYRFDEVNLLQSNLMMLGERDPNLSCLSDYLLDKFCRNMLKIIEAAKDSGLELSPEQILLFQVCSGSGFGTIENFLKAEKYYAGKKGVVKIDGGIITKKMPETNTAAAQEPSRSPSEASADPKNESKTLA